MDNQQINSKVVKIIRQYKLCGFHIYIAKFEENIFNLYSSNKEEQKKSLENLKSLLLTYRAWDGYELSKNPNDFIDDYNSFDEWYSFLKDFITELEQTITD